MITLFDLRIDFFVLGWTNEKYSHMRIHHFSLNPIIIFIN